MTVNSTEQWTRQKSEQQVRGPPDCPVPHEDKASNGRPAPSLTTRWRGDASDTVRWHTTHCLVAHRTVQCAHRQQPSPTAKIWLVAINITPTDHFKGWEPKQHSKSSSWHIQALPTTYIHWSILYTRFRPLQPTQVPQKREQARKGYSFEFSTSALWDSLRDSVCYIFVFICAWSFDSHWTSSKVLEACKASKRHLSVWWSLRGLKWSLRRRRARRSLVIGGERERVERDPSLVDSSTGTRPSRTEPR
jgi:hypothetical protein